MDLVKYMGQSQQAKQGIIGKQEYGTYVEKQKKKKKKNKQQDHNKNKDIDEQKIKQAAQKSQLHKCAQLTQQQKQRYSIAENHPLKIICSNLPFKITVEQIFQYFNTLISTSNPELATPPPIKDVSFDKAKTFAILTLSSRKIKDFFRSHSQVSYIQGTTTFKMVKPKQFFEKKYLKKQLKEAGEDNKIYLGGLPLSFMDEQVRKICQTFGKLKFFNLVKQGNVSKGYCFFEYDQHKNAQKAIKALNGLPIGDKRLKCHSATLGNKGLSLSFTPTSNLNTGLIQKVMKPANHSMGSYLLSYENITNPEVQMTIISDPLCKVASRVIQFLNMFYPEDLYDDEFYQDLQMDVRQICSKYGPIEQLIIPRPDKKCGYSVPSVGKVFVKFMYIIHAKKARHAISGRVYNKRTCVVSFYPQEKFNTRQYLVTL